MFVLALFVTIIEVGNSYMNLLISARGLTIIQWILLIVFAIVIEVVTRYFTRGMENKRKRELYLSLIWVTFGMLFIVFWMITK